MLFLGAFLILAYSRVAEVVGIGKLHLPLLTGGTAALIALLAGRVQQTLHYWLTRLMVLFTVWFMVCIPFAFWRGGSFNVLVDRWSRSFLVFFLIVTLVHNLTQLRRVCLLLFCSISLAAIMATTVYGVISADGRLSMRMGELANANQFAMVCLMGLPFGLAVICDSTWPKMLRILSCGPMMLLCITILRTGSRTGLLALVLLALAGFLLLPTFGRLVWILGAVITVIAVMLILPDVIATRLSTVFDPDIEADNAAEMETLISSEQSTASRLQVIKEGFAYTLEKPVFGLGPGNFIERRNTDYHEKFGHHGYLESHNSYVQVASEMGIPGLLIFVASLLVGYRISTRVYGRLKHARSPDEIRLKYQALGMRLIVLVMALFAVFNHIAYDFYIPTVLALVLVLERIVDVQATPAVAAARPAAAPVVFQPVLPRPVTVSKPAAPRPRLNGSPRRYSAAERPRR